VDVQVQTSDEAQNGKFIAAQRESGIQGLGLDFDYSAPTTVSHIAQRGSAQEGVKGFAPITTDLLRQASRCMNRFPSHEAASPHL
ncbi:hypothetical protein, partial [Escherichia coli]|uniref:hypothetical protein n=1 Tax=Escherichia coli TaxID=562 RepID=UPI003C75EDEE